MADYDNNMRGVLFKNDKKEKENQPDYKGQAEVDGVEYWISSWIKTPKAGGAKFMSISFTAKEQPAGAPMPASPPAMPPQRTPQPPADNFLDDPFGKPPSEDMPTGDEIPY